jgi:hypothetical protein
LPFQTAATREGELVLLRDAPIDREANLNLIVLKRSIDEGDRGQELAKALFDRQHS